MENSSLFSVPNEYASRKEKCTPEYGLSYANFIEYQQYKLTPTLNERSSRFKTNIKFAEGLQTTTDMRALYSGSGGGNGINWGTGGAISGGGNDTGNKGTSPLMLDIRPVNRIKKNIEILLSILLEQSFTIECNAIDPESKLIEKSIINRDRVNMILKQLDDKHNISGRTGIPLVPQGTQIPKDEEEAQMFAQLKGKVGVSLAMEEAIMFVLDNNEWDYAIKRKVLRNLLVNNLAGILMEYDENGDIIVTAPESYDIITPYSKPDTFSNMTYCGVQTYMTIQEIGMKAKKPDGTPRYTEKELAEMAKKFEGQNYNNPLWQAQWGTSYEGFYTSYSTIRPYYNFYIPILRFWFISQSTETLVKTQIKGKDGKWTTAYDWKAKPANADNSKNVKENIGVKQKLWRYEGYKIIGKSDKDALFNYKESENIPREKMVGGYAPTTTLPLVVIAPDIHDMENKSKVEAAIPAEEQLNLIEQKIQQCLIEFRPVGYAINTAILEEIKAGQGNNQLMSPVQIHNDFTQTNKLLYYAIDQYGNPLNIQPVTEVPSGFAQSFNNLLELRQMYLQTIDDVMGVSVAMNTTPISPEMPVGALEAGKQATMNSIMDTYKSAINLFTRMVKGLVPMIQDSIEKNPDSFISAIGQTAVSEIEHIQHIPMASFGINIDIGSSQEEKAQINQWIDFDVKSNIISSVEAMDVQDDLRKSNKLAKAKLRQAISANQKAMQDAKNQDVQNNMQSQMQSTQVASQLKQQEIQLETQAKIQLLQSEYQLKGQFSQAEFQQAMELQKLKNLGSNTDSEIAAGGKVNVQDSANKGKVVAQQIASNTQLAVKKIEHHSAHTQLHHEQQNALELQENEPPEKTEESDTNEKRYIVGNKAYKASVLKKHGHDISKLKEYK